MFPACARFNSGPVELAIGMVFERRFRTFAVNRRGLTFDTRFAPPVAGSSDGVIVYFLLDGTLRWSDGREITGPSLVVMRESDFEGSYGSRAMSFRSWGAPYHTLELRIAPTDCAMALGEQATVIGITSEDAPLVASARLYLHAIHSRKDVTTTAGLAGAYFLQLRSRGILAADLAATITLDEGVRGIAWSAFRPLIESLGRGAKRTDLAPRNHALLVRTALSFGLAWLGGWRDITVCYRVRVATLLLSSPALSIGEVADAVGYTSVEALAHALRAYELPSASEIRRELGAEETPTSTASVT